MPIKPENRGKYPKDWPQIRARILERAGHKCERCNVPNKAIGYRLPDGYFRQLADCRANAGDEVDAAHFDGLKVVEIVLTIAHVNDPDPANCADDNLEALCQRCHNLLDAPMRAKNAAQTRRAKKDALYAGVLV